MKISSLTKVEVLYLLNLYKELNKIEEQLDDYISNTAAPEVLNIKKNMETAKEASEILNKDISKDTHKMIDLLEEYIESTEEIENAKENSKKIMYVIEELLDKKSDIENEINAALSKTVIEKNYDSKEKIDSGKCKIISSDKKLIDRIVEELNNNIVYILNQKSNNLTDDLIKIVDEHINEKKKDEEEKLKLVQIENEEEVKENISNDLTEEKQEVVAEKQPEINEESNVQEQSQETVINLPTNEVIDNPVNIQLDDQSSNIVELPKVNSIPVEDNKVELANNYVPISDVLDENVLPKEEPVKEENILWVDTDFQNKKVAKIPLEKKETVSKIWEGYARPVTFKQIENIISEEKNNENVAPTNFNIENFATNKAA